MNHDDGVWTSAERDAAARLGPQVGSAMREARLRCPYAGGSPLLLHFSMSQTTFPFLVETARLARSKTLRQKKAVTLFDLNDCGYLYHVFRALYPGASARPRSGGPEDDAVVVAAATEAGDATTKFLNLVPYGRRGPRGRLRCAHPRCLAVPVFEAFVAALARLPPDPEDAPPPSTRPAPKNVSSGVASLARFFGSSSPPGLDATGEEERHQEAFLDLELLPPPPMPTAYFISMNDARRAHMEELLPRLGLFERRWVRPVPADEETRRRAQDLYPSVKLRSASQSSHLLTYLGVLEDAREEKIFVFEDDVDPLYDDDEMRLLLRVCAERVGDGVDSVSLEWCGAFGSACSAARSFDGLLETSGRGSYMCLAASFYGDTERRRSLPFRLSKFLLGAGKMRGATDEVLQSMRVDGFRTVRFMGPLFVQNRGAFDSHVVGSVPFTPACHLNHIPIFPWAEARVAVLRQDHASNMVAVVGLVCVAGVLLVVGVALFLRAR